MPRRSRRRRGESPKVQGNERWLVTYADLLTLLLVFFVIMFAMSSIDKVRFEAFAKSMQAALHKSDQIPLNGLGESSLVLSGAEDTSTQNPTSAPSLANATGEKTNLNQDQQKLSSLYQLISQYIVKNHLQNQLSIANQERGVQITMRDVALFSTGEAVLSPPAQKLINGFVPFFKGLPNSIVVEGYTDNQPISTSIYPSNWELSSSRAMSVVHFLSSHGIQPERLSGTGYGQYHNIAPNDTPQHRQMNRRVNIVVLRQGLQPGTAAAQP